MRTSVSLALIVMLSSIALPVLGEPYPQEVRQAFLDACRQNSENEESFCQCCLDKLEARVPYAELTEETLTAASADITAACSAEPVAAVVSTDELRTAFTSQCVAAGAPDLVCQCLVAKIEAQLPLDQLTDGSFSEDALTQMTQDCIDESE